jgi:membrane protein implicated in regulation of membrane protease activity
MTWKRVLRYIVVPLIAGGTAGWIMTLLPDPWPLVIMIAVIIAAVIVLIWSVRDMRRTSRQLEELVARMEEADGRVAYLMTDEDDRG